MDQIKFVIPYDTASVWRVDGGWQMLIISRDLPPEVSLNVLKFRIDEDNSSHPLLQGERPFILNNNVQEELTDFKGPHSYVNSWLAVPLKMKGKIIGLIALDGKSKGLFTEHHAELAVTFANQVAIALENASLFINLQSELEQRRDLIEKLKTMNAEAETLRESTAIVAATLEISETVQRVLEQIKRVVQYDSASVWLYQDEKAFMLGSNNLPPGAELPGEYVVSEQEPDYRFWSDKAPYILLEDIQDQYPMFRKPPKNYIHGWLSIPLRARGELTGFISLDSRLPRKFTEHDAELALTFANQVSIALENASLFADLQAELRKQIALRSASTAISSSLHLEQVLGEICKQMGVILDATSAYIAEYDKTYSAYTMVAEYVSSTANANEKLSDLGMAYHVKNGAWLFDESLGEDFVVVHAEDEDLSSWTREMIFIALCMCRAVCWGMLNYGIVAANANSLEMKFPFAVRYLNKPPSRLQMPTSLNNFKRS